MTLSPAHCTQVRRLAQMTAAQRASLAQAAHIRQGELDGLAEADAKGELHFILSLSDDEFKADFPDVWGLLLDDAAFRAHVGLPI